MASGSRCCLRVEPVTLLCGRHKSSGFDSIVGYHYYPTLPSTAATISHTIAPTLETCFLMALMPHDSPCCTYSVTRPSVYKSL